MITRNDLENREAVALPPRQSEALQLVEQYYRVAGEPPSYGWLARKTGISRQGAYDLMRRARERRSHAQL